MQQISIFELLDERRIEDMSCLEIAQEIAGRFGKEATRSRFEGYYEFKTGKCLIVIGKDRYYPEVHGGAWHISVDFQYKDGGYACPCDSFEEAIRRIGSWIERHK